MIETKAVTRVLTFSIEERDPPDDDAVLSSFGCRQQASSTGRPDGRFRRPGPRPLQDLQDLPVEPIDHRRALLLVPAEINIFLSLPRLFRACQPPLARFSKRRKAYFYALLTITFSTKLGRQTPLST
jgi:hypothetical protein